jgi:2-oxoglutarate dehydrogenase E2 component (dihydrolipoamide succinyltransferase)
METGDAPTGGKEEAKSEPKEPAPKEQETSSQPQGGQEKEAPKPKEEPKAAPKEEPKAAEKKPSPPPQPKKEEAPKKPADTPWNREERRVKMNRMRLRIAERLKQAQNTAASLSTFQEVDMSSLFDLRKQYKDEYLKKTGTKIGFLGPFARAVVLAMKEVPSINAGIEGPNGGDTIVYHDYVDISIAVATEKGLTTPVVRNVESMNILEIEKCVADAGKKVCSPYIQPRLLEILANTTIGKRRQTNHRGPCWRHFHYQQRWGVWLANVHTNHQPAASRCIGTTCSL